MNTPYSIIPPTANEAVQEVAITLESIHGTSLEAARAVANYAASGLKSVQLYQLDVVADRLRSILSEVALVQGLITEMQIKAVTACGCNGNGWILSDRDVWNQCFCFAGQRHPEDDQGDWEADASDALGEAQAEGAWLRAAESRQYDEVPF